MKKSLLHVSATGITGSETRTSFESSQALFGIIPNGEKRENLLKDGLSLVTEQNCIMPITTRAQTFLTR